MKSTTREHGYAMLGLLILVALSLIFCMGMLESSSTNAKTRALITTQADHYYEVEETVNRVIGWLQENSENLAGLFEASTFESQFDVGDPEVGTNEGEFFEVPSLVKVSGTGGQSAILSNNTHLGVSSFPLSTNISTGASFDAVSSFENADFGAANARLLLVWARPTNGAYEPIFRIDVMTGNHPDRGVHSYSHVFSKVVPGAGTAGGFYGQTALLMGNSASTTCSSLRFTHDGTQWQKGGVSSGCLLASDGTVTVSGTVAGTAASLAADGVVIVNNKGSLSPGPECEGAGCHTFALPAYDSWATACPNPGDQLDITASSYVGSLPAGCYRDLMVDADFALLDRSAPYHFRKINFQGNSNELTFGSIPVGQRAEIYVEEIDSNPNRSQITGNRVMNKDSSGANGKFNAPHQLLIHYTGVKPIQFGGTSDIYAHLIAPSAAVTSTGNTDFYGGIEARSIQVTGNADYFYDENIGVVQPLSNLAFEIRKTSQRYR